MSRRNRWEHRTHEGLKFGLVGPPQPDPEYGLYLRIEDRDGNYVGSLDGGGLWWLAKRLQKYLLTGRKRKSRK